MSAFSRLVLAAAASLSLCAAAPSLAEAKVHITVDLDMQTIHVEGKDRTFNWKVSSGKSGYDTPAGTFKVLWMDKDHHSDEYEQAYMPNAIFFAPGFAIHGFAKSPWGRKASHGCVRLPMAQSALLFDMVKAEGADITITGVSDRVAPTVAQIEAKKREAAAAADDGGLEPATPAAIAPRRSAASVDRASVDPAAVAAGPGYAPPGYGAPGYAAPGYGVSRYATRAQARRGDDGYADADYGYAPPRPPRGGLAGLFGGFY